MNTKLITVLTLGALPLVGAAMPTKAELDKVSPVVMDLMRPDQEALKAGKKTKSEVAAAALDLVAKADGEAAKLLLTKGAYNLYVRDGDFEKAIETLKSFREIVPDMEPQYLANIIESSLRTISRKNGGQLYQLLAETRTLARYRDELKKLEAQAKKDASDKTLQLKLAEHYAVLGDWPKALDAFAKSSGRKAADAAKAEKLANTTPAPVGEASLPRQNETVPTLKSAADYWWNYSTRKAPEFEKPFRQHAARLYEKAIATGELVGLNKVQADRRIEEANALGETVYEAPATKDGLYCVIDLSGGPNAKRYPVSYLNAIPKGGWTDEYKTTKLVLRRIEPGTFLMGDLVGKNKKYPQIKSALSMRFYIGVFEVTQRQWELVSGTHPAWFSNDAAMRPVESVSFVMVRGDKNGNRWPCSASVDNESFIGLLRAKSGVNIDLPTETQWEYACRAGTASDYNNGKNRMGSSYAEAAISVARCWENGWNLEKWGLRNAGMGVWEKIVDKNCGPEFCTAMVGTYHPNAWGLYDMHGNVKELCLDWFGDLQTVSKDSHGADSGELRVCRGGCWRYQADGCTSFSRTANRVGARCADTGFRLAIQPPFVPPKGVADALQSPDANLAKAKREMEEKIAAQHEAKAKQKK